MMKKNKLYTANKWNQSAFMPQEKNLFSGLFGSSQMNQPFKFTGFTPKAQAAIDKNIVASLPKAGGASGLGAKLGAGTLGGSLLNTGADLVGGLLYNNISSGRSNATGQAIGQIGNMVGSTVGMANPVAGAAITFASNLVGGAVNSFFGSQLNEEKIAEIENQTENMKEQGRALSGASDTTELMNMGNSIDFSNNFSRSDVGNDGWFASEAVDRYNQLKKDRNKAKEIVGNMMSGAAQSLDARRDLALLSNITAYGGPLFNNNDDMGAIGYGFMSDYLDTKKKQAEQKNKMTNMFMGMPNSMFAFGGDIQTNSADFPTGLTHIGAGGSHEENPNDGVQMGVDNEGTPNLVEEGETVYDDYVFSNRIEVPEEAQKWLGVKGKDLTFAEASKQLEKEVKERPNDPVSRAGLKAQMERLEEEQEFVKRCTSYSVGEVYDIDNNEMSLLNHNGYEYEKLG